MKFDLDFQPEKVSVIIKKHSRAKRISMRLDQHNNLNVTIPKFLPHIAGKQFVKLNQSWIKQSLNNRPKRQPKAPVDASPEVRQQARQLIRKRLEYYNQYYNFTYHRITIRDQKTRWGSCSSNKTLSFNFRLALLPQELLDYVVVHELCHLKEMNHSRKFWDLVAKTLPHYPLLKRKLRDHEKELL